MPLEGGEGLAGVGVPDPRRIVGRGGDDPLAVGAERGGVDRCGVPLGRVAKVLPESASQTRAVLSPEAVTTRLPSGLNAAEKTYVGVPLEGGEELAGVGVPDPRRGVG